VPVQFLLVSNATYLRYFNCVLYKITNMTEINAAKRRENAPKKVAPNKPAINTMGANSPTM